MIEVDDDLMLRDRRHHQGPTVTEGPPAGAHLAMSCPLQPANIRPPSFSLGGSNRNIVSGFGVGWGGVGWSGVEWGGMGWVGHH